LLPVQRVGDSACELQEAMRIQPNLSSVHPQRLPRRPAVGPLHREPDEHAIGRFDVEVPATVCQHDRASERNPTPPERMHRQRHCDVVRRPHAPGCSL
jgi:hypothetical protein